MSDAVSSPFDDIRRLITTVPGPDEAAVEAVRMRDRQLTKPAGSLLKGAEADEAGNVGEIGDLQPGQAKTLTLPLESGHYALICNLPGHYKAGQHADFTVR